MSVLTEIQESLAGSARESGDAVVGVGRGWRIGSGVVIGEGRVLTAARHAGGDGTTVTFADGRSGRGEAIAADRELGVAVLEVATEGAQPLRWASGDRDPAIGDPVIALANPGGRGLHATLGFVSATPRSFRGPRGRRLAGAIEHTAPLPRGSAGGPLLDAEGRLTGINMLRSEGGLILALGANGGLSDAVEGLARGEEVSRPTLGVAVAPAWVARKMRRAVGLPERDGVLVRWVEEGGAADRAGVERGDLIVSAGGGEVTGVDALHRALDEAASNGGLSVTVVRGAEEHELSVDLAAGAE